jgi:hypothetical protein
MALASGDQHGQRTAAAIGGQLDLGGEPTPAASQGLVDLGSRPQLVGPSPVRAPAACWWARTMVASTTTSQSTSPTASERVWAWANNRCQVPSACQQRNRSEQVGQGP